MHDTHGVTYAVDVGEDMRGHNHCLGFSEFPYQVKRILSACWIKTSGGFIPDEKLGIIYERGCNTKARGHAGRETFDGSGGGWKQIDSANQACKTWFTFFCVHAEQLTNHVKIGNWSHGWREFRICWQITHSLSKMRCVWTRSLAEKLCTTCCGYLQSHQ
jgi:hypothetical protein